MQTFLTCSSHAPPLSVSRKVPSRILAKLSTRVLAEARALGLQVEDMDAGGATLALTPSGCSSGELLLLDVVLQQLMDLDQDRMISLNEVKALQVGWEPG